MTTITANELLKEWQERLGLMDWCISLKINVTQDDFESNVETAGETAWNNISKTAVVKIIDENLYGNGSNRIIVYDFERILVHELLHIKFNILQQEPFNYETTVFDEFQHQLIEDMAQAIIMAKRGKTKRTDNLRVERVKDYSEVDK